MENLNQDINLESLVDIRDISMEEEWSRSRRIEYLKSISKDGFVKYDNVLIKLEFKSVFPKEYMEGRSE